MSTEPKVTYWAVSIFQSRTFWVAVATAVIGLVAEPEILAVIPLSWMPRIMMVVGLANVVLRKLTVRPVALIPPGDTKPVAVPKIAPPDPPMVTD